MVNVKLDYLKMSLRTAVVDASKIVNKKVKDDLEDIQSELFEGLVLNVLYLYQHIRRIRRHWIY